MHNQTLSQREKGETPCEALYAPEIVSLIIAGICSQCSLFTEYAPAMLVLEGNRRSWRSQDTRTGLVKPVLTNYGVSGILYYIDLVKND